MFIVQKIKKNEDGTRSIEFVLTEEQMKYLVSYAVGTLVVKGLATLETQEDE